MTITDRTVLRQTLYELVENVGHFVKQAKGESLSHLGYLMTLCGEVRPITDSGKFCTIRTCN